MRFQNVEVSAIYEHRKTFFYYLAYFENEQNPFNDNCPITKRKRKRERSTAGPLPELRNVLFAFKND